MLRSVMLTAALLSAAVAVNAQQAGPPQELPTPWEVPPGDPVEHMTAGYAKILCSATVHHRPRSRNRCRRRRVLRVASCRASPGYENGRGPEGASRAPDAAQRGHTHCQAFPRPGMRHTSARRGFGVFHPCENAIVAARPGNATVAHGRPAPRYAAPARNRCGESGCRCRSCFRSCGSAHRSVRGGVQGAHHRRALPARARPHDEATELVDGQEHRGDTHGPAHS